jgi:hypothetical protein
MALVVLICLIWGFQPPAIKLAITERAAADSMRDPLGAGDADRARHHAPALACRSPRATARLGRAWSRGALFGFEFVLIYRGLLYTTGVARGAVHLSRAVLCAIGARWFLPGDRSA